MVIGTVSRTFAPSPGLTIVNGACANAAAAVMEMKATSELFINLTFFLRPELSQCYLRTLLAV
jgi:hypothetical protein